MSRQVAISVFPFPDRLRICCTVPTGRELSAAAASIALLHYLMANPTIIGATIFSHKKTIRTVFNGCTNNYNHPLSQIKSKKGLWASAQGQYGNLLKKENVIYIQINISCQEKIIRMC
jgi:hypothetical protein